MGDSTEEPAKGPRKFRILSIETAEPPAGTNGGEWFRYSIGHESSPIEGMRSGSLSSVRQHLEEYVENLNARATRGVSAYAPRSVKK